jgi:hypothetical protein
VHLFVDGPNILGGMHDTAPVAGASWSPEHLLCLDLPHLHRLMSADRKVERGVWAGTDRQRMALFWDRVRELHPAVEVLLHEEGKSGREIATDQTLQLEMLRLLGRAPGVLVLATGDGNGWREGRGFLTDSQLLVAAGWRLELLSWRCSVNRYLRAFAEEHGVFIALDDWFDQLTFQPGWRHSEPLQLSDRPQISPPHPALSAVFHGLSLQHRSILNRSPGGST